MRIAFPGPPPETAVLSLQFLSSHFPLPSTIIRLTPELKKRALELRSRTEAASTDAEESRRRRIDALQKRKLEKVQEEKVRVS